MGLVSQRFDGHADGGALNIAVEPEPELRTERLVMRRWRREDLDGFAAMNADPVVMEHFHHGTRTREQTAEFMQRIEQEWNDCGFGLWSVQTAASNEFIGFVGLHQALFEAPFTPAVEVGWRLAKKFWGYGYATEAARAALRYGFSDRGMTEIVSFTAVGNIRSQRVMERIGMTRDPDGDFEHPLVPKGHAVRPHVLYRLTMQRWAEVRG